MQQAAYSPAQFCAAHGIARTTLYELLKEGRGPRIFKVGRRTLISAEAAADWRKRMEEEAGPRSWWESTSHPIASEL